MSSPASPYARACRTDEQLVQAGNHLLYETQMIFNNAALLDDRERWGSGWEDKTLYMSTVEALLVHRRNLMDFYYPPPNHTTNSGRDSAIFATDFCDDWAPTRPATFKAEWAAISEEVHHMTYLRPAVARNWHYARMLGEIRELTADFTAAADGRLVDYTKAQLRGVLDGTRTSRAYIYPPAALARRALAITVTPDQLCGVTPGLSTPTSTVFAG
jgi:hypothetical protein